MGSSAGGTDADRRCPRLAPDWEERASALSPAEGFLLSRIDGHTPWAVLRQIGGLSPAEADRRARGLGRGRARAGRRRRSPPAPAAPLPRAAPRAGPAARSIPRSTSRSSSSGEILAFEARLAGATHHEILGVERGSDPRDDQARLLPALQAVPPGPLLPAQRRRLRARASTGSSGTWRSPTSCSPTRPRAPSSSAAMRVGAGRRPRSAAIARPAARASDRRAAPPRRLPRAVAHGEPRAAAQQLQDAREDARGAALQGAPAPRLRARGRAREALARGGRERAARDRVRSVRRTSTSSTSPSIQADVHAARAAELLAQADGAGAKADALRLLEEAIHYRPADAALQARAAALALEAGELEQRARVRRGRARARARPSRRTHVTLSPCLSTARRRSAARARRCSSAAALAPSDPDVLAEQRRLRRVR